MISNQPCFIKKNINKLELQSSDPQLGVIFIPALPPKTFTMSRNSLGCYGLGEVTDS
jgi:hypothetical protein